MHINERQRFLDAGLTQSEIDAVVSHVENPEGLYAQYLCMSEDMFDVVFCSKERAREIKTLLEAYLPAETVKRLSEPVPRYDTGAWIPRDGSSI